MNLSTYTAVLCDLDGCLISGDRVLPGATEFVAAHRDRLHIVSNNSTDTAETLHIRLRAMGLTIAADRILLAGERAVHWIARTYPGRSVEIFGSAAIRDRAGRLGLERADGPPDVVLLTRDTGFTYDSLQRLVTAIGQGARLVVSNIDATHPGPDGLPVPETGALLAAVRSCLPDIDFEVIGKPAPELLRAALERAGARADQAVLVGDNPATDGEGARRLGLDFVHVDPTKGGLAALPSLHPAS
jgi:HAD superfamily hydrolase (TIGR01450 family)